MSTPTEAAAAPPHPVRLALTAGIISTFFSVLLQAIEEFLHHPVEAQLRELLVIALTSIGVLLAIEPVLARIVPVNRHHTFPREDDILIRAAAFLTIVATALLHGLLHGYFTQRLTFEGLIILEQMITALVAPTLTTLAWLYGVRRKRPLARWYGFIGGALTGLVLVAIAIIEFYFLQHRPGFGATSPRNTMVAFVIVATIFLWFIIPTCIIDGYLGGLAIDRHWGLRPWVGIASGLMIAVAVEAACFYLATFVEASALKPAAMAPQRLFGSLCAKALIANVGWSIGIWVRSDADQLLRSAAQPVRRTIVRREVAIAIGSALTLLLIGLTLSFGTIALGNHLTGTLVARTRDPNAAAAR